MTVLDAAGIRRGRAQHRKQEWDSRLHEECITREQLDRLLRQHPTELELTNSWNAGAADAKFFAEMLGLKNGVDDVSWTDPWTATREKLHVDEVVPNVNPAVNNPAVDDEDDEDDDDIPPIEPVDDVYTPPADAVCTGLDVRVVVCQLLTATITACYFDKTFTLVDQFVFTVDPSDDDVVDNFLHLTSLTQHAPGNMRESETHSRFVTVPGTDTQISKQQLCSMVVDDVLRNGRADGTTLSKDRIARIKATAARVKAEAERRDDPAVEGERIHLQDDLAFCFRHSGGVKKLWIGKLQQMRSKIGRGTRNLHRSIDLCNPPDDLQLQCQWYHETRRRSGHYTPTSRTVNVDMNFVHVKSCLGLVNLKYNARGYYTISPAELNRLKRIMRTIN